MASLIGAAAVAPSTAFVASPAPVTPAALRASAAPSGLGAGTGAAPGATFGATAQTVGGLAAVAGLLSVVRSSRTSRRAKEVGDAMAPFVSQRIAATSQYPRMRSWFDTGKTPVPGSQKALTTMVGADVETSNKPWDPMGFSKLYDRNFEFNGLMTYPHVQWLREAEVKHGRICMLAFVGILAQQFGHISPPYPDEKDWTKALELCYADKTSTLGIVQISVFIMLWEGYFFPFDCWCGGMDREPGDYGFDPLRLTKKPNFDLKSAQTKELKNGRLAMIGMASMAAAYAIPGSVPMLTGFAVRPEATAAASSALCGQTRVTARPMVEASKTAARYTTQVILPSLAWIKTGVKASDLAPTELRAKTVAGNDILIGKTEGGKLFVVGNLCPHIGTPMSEGADVIGDVIVCPLHGSSFKTGNGQLLDWCPSPPIIGPLTGMVIEKKNLLVFEARESGLFGGGDIEVLVDTNAKRAYEANYWKGLLDAQGKDDGTFY